MGNPHVKPKAIGGTTGLSILLSGLASDCGAVLFRALGGAAAGGLGRHHVRSRLGPYRPYFIGAAALLMAVSVCGCVPLP